MLVLSASKYLYCNGLTNGRPAADRERNGDRVTEVARRLAFDWRIPADKENGQLYIVSDTTGREPRPLLKPVITASYEQFLTSSRPEDHIVIYFGGHAVAKEGKAYLAPVEGDLEDVESLIPLDAFYAKLKESAARQKVVIWDVCRLNEADDQVRPGSEPMSEELEKALLDAPPRTQVLIGCSAGQRAGEYRSTPRLLDAKGENELGDVNGSLVLSALNYAGSKGKARGAGKEAKPEEAIPVAEWFEAAKERAIDVAKKTGRPAPTFQIAGTPPQGTLTLAANIAPPNRIELPTPPKGLKPEQVKSILTLAELPALRPSLAQEDEPIEKVLPFAETLMQPYMPDKLTPQEMNDDPEKYKVRLATMTALNVVRKEWGNTTGDDTTGSKLRDRFEGDTDDNVKKAIVREQETPASIILELEEQAKALDAVMEELDKEPSKYWQVNYLYAVAEVKSRLAFMQEYNLLLGNIRTDALPERDAKRGETGYQMVSSEKMKSKREVKDLAEAGREIFTKIAEEHKGTPWAVLAKRAKSIALGLEWKPYAPNAGPMDEK